MISGTSSSLLPLSQTVPLHSLYVTILTWCSPDYMAPEVLNPPEAGYGVEVDWWSIGCLFFDMVCGYPPFSGDTPFEVPDPSLPKARPSF
jgi:serine/threonine protein kinase